jgi:hypothetical protein
MQGLVPQFLFRLALGIAIALACMPPRLAEANFCRLALWGLAGLSGLAALAVYFYPSGVESGTGVLTLALGMAAVSYAGSVFWFRQKSDWGRLAVGTLGLLALLAVLMAAHWGRETTGVGLVLGIADVVSSGLVLGVTIATVLLAIWHLNTPTMPSLPLRPLAQVMAAAVVVRTVLCPAAWGIATWTAEPPMSLFWAFLLLRWLLAVLGVTMLAMLAKEVRSKSDGRGVTGLLLLGVVVAMLGELGSQVVPVAQLYQV